MRCFSVLFLPTPEGWSIGPCLGRRSKCIGGTCHSYRRAHFYMELDHCQYFVPPFGGQILWSISHAHTELQPIILKTAQVTLRTCPTFWIPIGRLGLLYTSRTNPIGMTYFDDTRSVLIILFWNFNPTFSYPYPMLSPSFR